MASYTDNIPKFNPYVRTIPVDEMVKVGLYKQQKYEEGIQKIQTNIDNIAGLDIYKDSDKAYLQSKLNQLGNNLTMFAAGDFSNFQLVNSVNGMTNQIAKDPNVQNAVSSTAAARKELAYMDEERKKGNLNPANEYVFKQKFNSWANNSEIGQSFNAKYDPHFDIDKFIKETFDAVKPDDFSYDQVYQLDANGKPMTDGKGNLIYSPTMTRMIKEGRFPAKVKATLEQIMSDPRVAKQLSITGQYNYRGLDSNQLGEKITTQRDSTINEYVEQLNDLILKKSMGKDVQDEIDALESKINKTKSAYEEYFNLAFDNPDSARAALYKADAISRYTTMYSYVKEKNEVSENPNWNQNWKMQIEANAQSRFAQELRQRKIEYAGEMQYKYDALENAKEVARISAKGKSKGKLGDLGDDDPGFGPGGEPTEQGDQSAAIEVNRVQTSKFEKAADDYSSASNLFIWETIFSKTPSNITKLNGLMSKGVKRDEAINILINGAARKANKTPEEFKSYWTTKATKEYNSLTPDQKIARPIVADAYQAFRSSKRIFDSELDVKTRVDKQTQENLGEVAKKIAMADIKPQTIIYKDKKYTLTKEDAIDLAIYKKGNLGFLQSVFGGDDAEILEQDSKMALARLQKRGKGALAEAYVDDNSNVRVDSNGKVTRLDEGLWGSIKGLTDIPNRIRYQSEGWGGVTRDWSQVHAVEGMLNNEVYVKGMKKRAEIIQQHYNIAPNRNIDIMTGDAETDKNTLAKLKRWGGQAVSGSGNLSPDYKNFNGSLSNDPNDNSLGARTIFDENNNPMVEVISYDSDGERKGGLTLQPDQAVKIGIDLGSLYESKEASALRNKLNFNNYQSSNEDPSEVSTYLSGDSWYDKTDFPGMRGNRNLDVQSNIVYSNGKYYPFVYVSDGVRKPVVKQLNGDENLENLLLSLKKVVTPTFVQGLLTLPNK